MSSQRKVLAALIITIIVVGIAIPVALFLRAGSPQALPADAPPAPEVALPTPGLAPHPR